jgi:hypothetical protein
MKRNKNRLRYMLRENPQGQQCEVKRQRMRFTMCRKIGRKLKPPDWQT